MACGGTPSGIVEVGAGLGYWKWVLEGGGVGYSRGIGRKESGKVGAGGDYVINAGARASEAGSADAVVRVLAIDKDPAQLPTPDRENLSTTAETRGTGDEVEWSQQAGQGTGSRRGRGKSRRIRRGDSTRSPATACSNNEYHGGAPAWAVVETGGPERLRSIKAEAFPVLLLCYPPPSIGGGGGGGAAACMGANALATFSGTVLLYVGEVGGDTGSPRLEAMLQAEWDLVEAVELPCYSSTANQLMVFVRKGSLLRNSLALITSATVPRPLPFYRCAGCGCPSGGTGAGAQLHRCRLTRAVSYCSERCFTGDMDCWQANLEARHIFLPNGAVGGLVGVGGTWRSGDTAQQAFRDKKLFKRLVLRPL